MITTDPLVLLGIVLRTFVVYLVVVVGLRLFGKRELGQMTPFDLVLILTLSNAVQNAMTGGDNSLTGGIVAAATLLVANWALSKVGVDIPGVRKWLVGDPTLLMHDGHIFYDRMKREGIEVDDLLMAAREHGIDDLKGVSGAILEVDGSISIIPADSQPLRTRRKRHWRKNR